jgi:HSP20 family protein
MATDERKTPARESTRGPARTDVPSRRDDWGAFWNDSLATWWRSDTPFRRFAREMESWFHDSGFGRRQAAAGPFDRMAAWAPDVETFQRGDQFVVRADLPGLKREDVNIQITDDTLTIEGERRSEHEDRREGFYRTERSYGSFCRVVPLPDGAIADSAKATFQNGVLEVVMQAPPREVARGRRLEISDPAPRAEAGRKQIFPE